MDLNLVLITIDDLRADRVSSYFTPTLNRLMEKGAWFSQAVANGPNTSYSFPSLFSSTYPFLHSRHPKLPGLKLEKSVPTLPQILKREGYSTAGFSSGNPFLTSYHGYSRGFDFYEDLLNEGKQAVGFPHDFQFFEIPSKVDELGMEFLNSLSSKWGWFNKARALVSESFQTPLERNSKSPNDKVFHYLKEKDTSKVFLWVHYMDTHEPWTPPKESLSKLNYPDIPDREILKLTLKLRHNTGSIREEEKKRMLMLYNASVRYVDHKISLLLNRLEKLGLNQENTLFAITSDHGECFGEHGCWGHHCNLYEEQIRVPLILLRPGIEEREINNVVSHIDLMPTLLDLLGLEKNKNNFNFMGRSLNPLLNSRGSAKSEKRPKRGFGISQCRNINFKKFSCRTENWKYILTIKKSNINERLYDLNKKPREKDNVVEENPRVRKEMKNILLQHIKSMKKKKRRVELARVRKSIESFKLS